MCLFVCGVLSHSRSFHLYGDVTIAGERLQIFTYARHLWPLSSEGSLACHTYCDTSVYNGPVTLTPIAERLAVKLSLPVLRLSSVPAGIRTPNLPLANAINHCAIAAVWEMSYTSYYVEKIFHLKFYIRLFL